MKGNCSLIAVNYLYILYVLIKLVGCVSSLRVSS